MPSPLKPSDPIIGPPRGNYNAAMMSVHRLRGYMDAAVADYMFEVFRLAPLVGIDPAIVVAQAAVETGNFGQIPGAGATAWLERNNPGSIGITSTGKPGEKDIDAGHSWKDGTDAARGQIVHLYTYAVSASKDVEMWKQHIHPYVSLDPRYWAVVNAGYAGTVRLLSDLGNGKWAADKNYAAKIAARGNLIFGFTQETPPVALTFGKVPKPSIIDMFVEKGFDGAGFNYVPPRRCVGVCTHITDGNASLEWYHDFFAIGGDRANDALTDFGIDKAGRIAQWNDPFGNRSPWASGGSDGLEGDGPLFVRTLGIQGINGAIASMEHVARSPEKMTDAQLEASAQLTAWIFDGASNHPRGTKVPWHAYPLNPTVGCVTHMAHFEFATKPCPGPGIVAQIPALQDRVRAIMKKHQEGESQETVPPPKPVEPDHDKLPNGWTEGKIAAAFGTGKLVRPGKADSKFQFHLGRAWAEAYVERAGKEKVLPAVTVWQQVATDRDSAVDLISFNNGWLLLRFTDRGGWRWL